MTGRRYLAFLPTDEASYDRWRVALTAQSLTPWNLSVALDGPGCILLAQGLVLPVGGTGGIVGETIQAGASAPSDALSIADAAAIAASRGGHLIDRFWGAYVAFLPRPNGGTDVVRAPLGDLACYYIDVPGGTVVASDVDLLTAFTDYRARISWPDIAANLVAPDLRRATTCLERVCELGGGERLTAHASAHAVTAVWSPWSFVTRRPPHADIETTAERLRKVVCLSVAARVAPHDQSVLLLSGGLDSSVVAAALARWRCRASALTMVTRDRAGDERDYAQTTARHLGLPLNEVTRDIAAVDITISAAAGLPYPSARSFSQATMAAATAQASAAGATAIVNGGGGDNVFCAMQSAAPVTDLLRSFRFGRPLRATTASIAALAQATGVAVLRQAIARLVRPGPLFRWSPTFELLSDAAISCAPQAVQHPWLVSPRGALPGSAGHVGNILRALCVVQSPDARTPIPSIAVLLAQPIVEACLAVPSWCWFDDGHNRAFARHAFNDMLPRSIVWRRSKGSPDSFIVELFEANRALLRPFLLDGLLAASGLVDRAALEAALSVGGPTKGDEYGRIMQFADVEAWLRSWPR